MTRTSLILEIEELLFDTHAIRATALHDALTHEGATIEQVRVSHAHRGVPAAVALSRLGPALSLDATAIDLVLHRAADQATRSFSLQSPSFDADARDALEMLAAEFPMAVVTRASGAEAQRWLEGAGLDASVLTVRSMAGLDPADYVAVWADGFARSRTERGVAIAAPAMLRVARRAGLRTLQLGTGPDDEVAGYHPDAHLDSLSQLHAAFLATV